MQDEAIVTVTEGVRGYFAVLMCWNSELEMYEPWNTGFSSYGTPEEANVDAKSWAEAEELKYVPYGER